MKRLVLTAFAVLSLVTGLVIPPAQAQEITALKATIPFEFTVGATTLPPGDYYLKSMSSSAGRWTVLRIESSDRRETMSLLTSPVDYQAKVTPPKLVFNRYGEFYFLSQIFTGDGTVRRLPKSRIEIEVAKGQPRPGREATALSRVRK